MQKHLRWLEVANFNFFQKNPKYFKKPYCWRSLSVKTTLPFILMKARQEIQGTNFALYDREVNERKKKFSHSFGTNFALLYDREVNGGAWALAKMNMFLHGIEQSYIAWRDAILSPQFTEKQFNF